MPDMRERVARRSARARHAVPDGRVSAQRRRVTHEGPPDARAVRRVWAGPAPLLLRANGALRRALRLSDRKSTRLNSSHTVISYAVFCLKKKRKQLDTDRKPT